MGDRYELAIVGTGLFGAALAYHAAQDARSRVLALDLDPSPYGPNGTSASAGILSLQGWDRWDLAVVHESEREYRAIAESMGATAPRPLGGLRVARTEPGERWLERVRRVLEREGVPAHRVSAGEARDLVPYADLRDLRSGLFTPDDALLAPTELRDAYLRAARRRGVELRSLAGPAPLSRDEEGWRFEEPVNARARTIVLAAGAATKSLLRTLGHPLPLAPFRAQAARIRPRPLVAPFATLHDLDWNVYVRPDRWGRLLLGDGSGAHEEDPARWSADADPEFVVHVRTAVRELLSGCDLSTVESAWAGLCVASPDRYPLVGAVPGAAGLFVASGFNGFGTMRAAGLARRLAEAIRSGRWDRLAPADPARFAGAPAPFDPRPEFPLEGPEEVDLRPRPPTDPRPSFEPISPDGGAELRFRVLTEPGELAALSWSEISEWFDPFLPLFAGDALRTGGRVELAEESGVVRGVRLFGASEGVASGFTRLRRVAERFVEETDAGGIYLEEPWRFAGRPVELFAADLRDWVPPERLRNPVRIGTPEDLPQIGRLLRAELGPGVDPWIASLPRREETSFVGEIDRRVVAVSWLSRVGAYGRGHSFVVHPRYRGLGFGTDLLLARMLWLQRTGGRQVVSEIYGGNAASRIAAERAGMARVGQMYHVRRGDGDRGPTAAAPRTSGTP